MASFWSPAIRARRPVASKRFWKGYCRTAESTRALARTVRSLSALVQIRMRRTLSDSTRRVASSSPVPTTGDFAVWRYTASGKPDNHFGTAGMASTDMGSASDVAYSFAVAPSGAIILGGESGGSFAFARFTANGTLDTSFGSAGRALFTGSGGSDVVAALALEGNGNIVAAGADGAQVAVLSLTPAGVADPSFDGGNILDLNVLGVNTSSGTPADYTEGLAIQPNGQILVANRTTTGHFGVVRINGDGSLDRSFGNGGVATANFGGNDDADAVQVQGTGQIFAIGTTDAGGSAQTAVAAFTANGQLDPTFGVGGKFTISAGVTSVATPAVAGSVNPLAIHIGDIFLRAFGNVQPNGQLVVGTSNENSTSTSTSTPLRRLNVPGSGTVGTFGLVGGRAKKLTFLEADGTKVTISMKGGGMGTAFYNGTAIDLVLIDTRQRSSVSIKASGGKHRVALRNVTADGPLAGFSAKTADLSGTFYVPGFLGSLTLGTVSGRVAAIGEIGSLIVGGNVTGAVVLSGANLGSDSKLGGSGIAADSFSASSIGQIKIAGAVSNSTFGKGLNPVDNVFRNGNDTVIGGAASRIGSISVKHGVDAISRFYAGAFKKVKAPGKVVIGKDPRFEVL